MTEAQRLSIEFWDATEVFDGDVRAFAVALGGMLAKAGKKNDVEYVLREIDHNRFKKFEHLFPRVYDFTVEEVEQCKSLANCRFSQELGRYEEIEKLSKSNEMMNRKLIGQEIANLEAMKETIEKIQSNLRNNVVSATPKAIKKIRGSRCQGSLF